MSVRELSDDFVWSNNELLKESGNLLPDNIGEQLKNFNEDVLNCSSDVFMGYTESGFVLVKCFNKHVWTRELHNLFSNKFNLVLYATDCTDSYSPSGHEEEINYLYIGRPIDEYVSLISIDYIDW